MKDISKDLPKDLKLLTNILQKDQMVNQNYTPFN